MRAFTLVELLVVISIVSVLMAILVPALSGVRRQAIALTSMRNQREVGNAVNFYAQDHDDRYPPSVATVGFDDRWNWSEPTKLTGNRKRSPQIHRSMSAYLREYIPDAATLSCPSAPRQYAYLQEAWDAADDWDNPDTPVASDPVWGTYCFFWNYLGFLSENRLFRGPSGPASGGYQSQLLLTDYFGYGNWRSPDTYTSCERLPGSDIFGEQFLVPALWTADGDPNTFMPPVKLRAAYTDGHVESFTPDEAVPMRVSLTPEGKPPYPDGGASPGLFYLPRNAIR